MADKQDKKMKMQELGFLLNHGVKITFDKVTYKRRFPWSEAKEIRETKEYELQQPTLGVLDLINYYLADINIDEDVISSSVNPYPYLRSLSKKHLYKVSMAVAAAVIGRRSFIKKRDTYVEDTRLLKSVAYELIENVTPSKLMEIAQAMSVMSNLSDFLNSIRLLQIAPDRIEPTEAE